MKKQTNSTRWWDLPAALILVVANFLTASRLASTNWTDELSIVYLIAFTGTLAGLALGMSIFSRRWVAFFSTTYGLFIILWQLGNTLGEGIKWLERLKSLGGRFWFSFLKLIQQKAVTDPILFLLFMALLFWLLASYAGYSLTRHADAWRAVIPTGVALFVIHTHDYYVPKGRILPKGSLVFASFIFLALILVSRMLYMQKRHTWREKRTHMPPYVGIDFLRVTLIAGGILMVLAWTVPVLAADIPPIRQAWQKVSQPYYAARDRFGNAFASLRASVGIVRDYYGETLPLGRGNALTDNVVLAVAAEPRPNAGIRYYWQARVYNHYEDSLWSNKVFEKERVVPDEFEPNLPEYEGRWETNFVVVSGVQMATLYTAPQPVWVSRPINLEYAENPDGTVDIFALQASPSIRPGDSYEFRSSVTNVTIAQLREAGDEYPEYIKNRYLNVPEHITPRTRELAQRIAEGKETPYDIADAVTLYLRANIEYADTVPTPPSEQDVIDWILFDLQQGFCNYYATAEVILLRSLGIPARLAVGYAQGERNPETNVYAVRQRDAHAWPEVFFPGIGWVEFEPTLNQVVLRRLSGEGENGNLPTNPGFDPNNFEDNFDDEFSSEENLPEDAGELGEGGGTQENQRLWMWLGLIGVGLLGGSIFGWLRNRNKKLIANTYTPLIGRVEKRLQLAGFAPPDFLVRWSYRAGLPAQARAYHQINTSLKRLKAKPNPNHTPKERALTLQTLLPNASPHVALLLREYQGFTYGKSAGHPAAAMDSARTIRIMTWINIIQKLLARFQEPVRQDLIQSLSER